MTWESFYLICFLVGFLLSLAAFLGQAVHFHGHVPHFGDGGHGAGAGHGGHTAAAGDHGLNQISPINMMTITAFLAWFGGTGYLLERHAGMWVWFGFGVASVSGLAGAALVFWVLGKLLARDVSLDPGDYDMVGVLGRVTSPVREGGTGEMVFSQEGVRRSAGVRSEDGARIEKGAEVVVTRYEKGIAYVRRWESLVGSD